MEKKGCQVSYCHMNGLLTEEREVKGVLDDFSFTLIGRSVTSHGQQRVKMWGSWGGMAGCAVWHW